MLTPAKGDYASVHLNAEARQVADAWIRPRTKPLPTSVSRTAEPPLARAWAHPHDVGEREHTEDRDGCRHADSRAEVRQAPAGTPASQPGKGIPPPSGNMREGHGVELEPGNDPEAAI